jgi:putative ABC transport system permease protein
MSAVGLFSMVTYSVASRTKEFGIRKLLGASGPNITFLVAKDFLRLVIIAYVLSLPFAWFIAERWVNNFAYKTEITWWVFALTGVILLVVCFLTLSYQALRACRTNPVENLRHE